MTDRELFKMALDALQAHADIGIEATKQIELLRARLAQPEPEPVAWGIANTRPTEKQPLMMVMLDKPEPSHLVIPLYTAPPQREWVGLTDEAAQKTFARHNCTISTDLAGILARAIIAKLKEKNGV